MVILTIQFLQCIFKWRSVIYIHWVYSQIPIRLLPPYLNNIKLRLIIHGCLYTESVTVHNHFIAAFEFLSYCKSQMYSRKKTNALLFISLVIQAYMYLDIHEKHCSHTSVSTYIFVNNWIQQFHVGGNVKMTLSKSLNLWRLQVCLHHSSTCPDMCSSSITIFTSDSLLARSVRHLHFWFWAYQRRRHPSLADIS